MKYRSVPGSDLVVSEVGFAVTSAVAEALSASDPLLAERLLRQAYDRGVTLFDVTGETLETQAESLLSRSFSPEKILVVCAFTAPAATAGPASAREIILSCERTLRRLKRETADIYLFPYEWMESGGSDAAREALLTLMERGLVRAAGLNVRRPSLDPSGLKSVAGAGRFSVVHLNYHLFSQGLAQSWAHYFERQAVQKDLVALARCPNISAWPQAHLFRFLEEGAGRTLGQAALQFILAKPWAGSAITDFESVAAVEELSQAPLAPPLTEPELNAIESLWRDQLASAVRLAAVSV